MKKLSSKRLATAITTTVLGATIATMMGASAASAAGSLFSDDFNRADGALGSSWSQTPFGPVPTIDANRMCTASGIEGVAMLAAAQFDSSSSVGVQVDAITGDGANLKVGFVLANFVDGNPVSFAFLELRRDFDAFGSPGMGTLPGVDIVVNSTFACSALLSTPTLSNVPYRLEGQLLPNGDAMVTLTNLDDSSVLGTASCNIGAQAFQTVVTIQGRNNSIDATCLDNFVLNGTAPVAPTCNDGLQNQGETGVDCGGPCAACAPTCSDGVQNGFETGVDCGGTCPACFTCSDGLQNQGETGIDCGGPCAACPTCSDGSQNQGETGIDCGGPCTACPTCSDGLKNQGETEVDCGGPCAACPTCNDGVQNGAENGIDCGGTCTACDATGCSAAPLGSCRVALVSVLSVGDNVDDTMDRVAWTWKGGEATGIDDLEDPTVASSYRLCIYAGGANVSDTELVGGSTCGTPATPCWKTPMFGQGYVFKDAAGSQGGINVVKLMAGIDGKASAKVTGRGPGLADLTLPLAAPVVVELQNIDTGICFSSSFAADDITRNNATRGMFTAKSKLPALP